MVYQIAYFSSASPSLKDEDVANIMRDARAKNALLNVTGMLLLIDEVFFQILEGDRETVENLVKRIERNPLHSGMIRVMHQERDERLFPGWSMGFEMVARGRPTGAAEMPFDIADLAANPVFATLAAKAPELISFMRSLYHSRHMVGAPVMPAA